MGWEGGRDAVGGSTAEGPAGCSAPSCSSRTVLAPASGPLTTYCPHPPPSAAASCRPPRPGHPSCPAISENPAPSSGTTQARKEATQP